MIDTDTKRFHYRMIVLLFTIMGEGSLRERIMTRTIWIRPREEGQRGDRLPLNVRQQASTYG